MNMAGATSSARPHARSTNKLWPAGHHSMTKYGLRSGKKRIAFLRALVINSVPDDLAIVIKRRRKSSKGKKKVKSMSPDAPASQPLLENTCEEPKPTEPVRQIRTRNGYTIHIVSTTHVQVDGQTPSQSMAATGTSLPTKRRRRRPGHGRATFFTRIKHRQY